LKLSEWQRNGNTIIQSSDASLLQNRLHTRPGQNVKSPDSIN
jgi:hypothetical protein